MNCNAGKERPQQRHSSNMHIKVCYRVFIAFLQLSCTAHDLSLGEPRASLKLPTTTLGKKSSEFILDEKNDLSSYSSSSSFSFSTSLFVIIKEHIYLGFEAKLAAAYF